MSTEPGEEGAAGGEDVPADAAARAPSDPELAEPPERPQKRRLRNLYARAFLFAVFVQLLIADALFAWYGYANGWRIDSTSIDVWLSATVVEIVGVVLAITAWMFPRGGDNDE